MADRVHREDVIIFGYIDVFRNDHTSIAKQIFPHFLIFKEGEENPIEIDGSDFQNLFDEVLKVIKDYVKPENYV